MRQSVTHRDLLEMMGSVRTRLINFPMYGKLDGMNRPLTDGETVALCMLEAAEELLNRKGLLREATQTRIDTADSEPEVGEEADFDLSQTPEEP